MHLQIKTKCTILKHLPLKEKKTLLLKAHTYLTTQYLQHTPMPVMFNKKYTSNMLFKSYYLAIFFNQFLVLRSCPIPTSLHYSYYPSLSMMWKIQTPLSFWLVLCLSLNKITNFLFTSLQTKSPVMVLIFLSTSFYGILHCTRAHTSQSSIT